MTFILHPQLAADTLPIGDLPLCRVLLMNDANFPWLILVPRRASLRELFDLEPHAYAEACQEIRMVAEKLSAHTKAYKINIAALGNMVPQLHIHIIARFENDAAWPNPVWNSGVSVRKYHENNIISMCYEIRNLLGISAAQL